jgi:hypothetical protein
MCGAMICDTRRFNDLPYLGLGAEGFDPYPECGATQEPA